MMKYKVSVRKIEDPGGSPLSWKSESIIAIAEDLHRLLANIDFDETNIRGKSVLLHPNLVRPHRSRPASFTDPRLILAAASYFLEMGASSVAVGENPGFGYSSRDAFQEAGLVNSLKKMNVKIKYFDEENWVEVENPQGRLYRNINVASSVLETDIFVNIPKLKTHMLTGVSLCLKNLLGVIHDNQRQIFHRNDIADKIVDLNYVRSPDLNIVDGLWAMEGQAPFNGDTVQNFNLLLAGTEAAAVDALCCSIIGIQPQEIPHVQLGCHRLLRNWNGLNSLDITGDEVDKIKRNFKRPILSSMAQFDNINCIECGVCRGCLSAVRHSLDWLAASGELKNLPEITIVSGRAMPNMKTLETWSGKLILFGNCAAEFQFFDAEKRLNSTLISGCAPHVLDLANILRKLPE